MSLLIKFLVIKNLGIIETKSFPREMKKILLSMFQNQLTFCINELYLTSVLFVYPALVKCWKDLSCMSLSKTKTCSCYSKRSLYKCENPVSRKTTLEMIWKCSNFMFKCKCKTALSIFYYLFTLEWKINNHRDQSKAL